MPTVKSASEIASKWGRVTPGRSEDYQSGVTNPTKDWETNTKAAEDRYKDGVTKASARGAFGKGVAKAGTKKWQEKATTIGVNRWAEGVQAGQDAYAEGFAPYADVISRTTLPARYPKGDSRNINRVTVMAKAMRDKKESLT